MRAGRAVALGNWLAAVAGLPVLFMALDSARSGPTLAAAVAAIGAIGGSCALWAHRPGASPSEHSLAARTLALAGAGLASAALPLVLALTVDLAVARASQGVCLLAILLLWLRLLRWPLEPLREGA